MLLQASQWSQSSHFTISVGNNLAVPGPGTSTQQPSRRWVSLEPNFLNYGLRSRCCVTFPCFLSAGESDAGLVGV